jgi:uncharacterized cupredoxin-like copper-binding protein
MRYRSILILVVAVALAAAAVGGCGGDDDGDGDGTTTAADTGTVDGAGAVTVKMGDFFFDPKDATAEAGSVTVSAPNAGKVEHELVLFKSDDDPASLPVSGGGVDEEALEKQGAELVGEIEGVQPGQTKDASFDLTAGKYVMFCNLPAHYEQGMYGSFTVK